ncbi:MAG: hypothetical protein V9G18_12595 [Albidovulum sp.]
MIEAECIEGDKPVDAAITGAAQTLRHIMPAAAVTHGQQHVDHQMLEEFRLLRVNAGDEIVDQRRLSGPQHDRNSVISSAPRAGRAELRTAVHPASSGGRINR